MWIKILHILYLCSYFALRYAYADFSLASSYSIFIESIFQLESPYITKDDSMGECKINLKDETLEFECTEYLFSTEMKGSFNLDKEAINSLHCLAQLQEIDRNDDTMNCDMSEEDYQTRIFKNCNEGKVHQIKIVQNQESEQFKSSEFLNFVASSLTNLNQITWYQEYDECQPLNQFLRNFKYLQKVLIYFQNAKELIRCEDYNFANLTKIVQLQIDINVDDSYNTDNVLIFNENLLRGTENLEVFELKFLFNLFEVNIPKHVFKGLTKLMSLRFINCNIQELTGDHFHDLVNLKSLTIRGGSTYNFDWLSLPIIKNKLLFLELYMDIPSQEPNITAYLCQDSHSNCAFNVDINKKPCPKDCDCYLNRLDMKFKIDCLPTAIGMKIPELPIPITGRASLYFNNKNLTQLPNSTLYGYANLRELHLANNKLTSLIVEQLPSNLTYLDLRNNSLQTLDHKVLEFLSSRAGRISMDLSGNPWKCNCDALNLLHFVANSTNKINDRLHLKCHDKNHGLSMLLLNAGVCSPYAYFTFGSILGSVVMIILYSYFKKSIFMWLYERNLCLNWISRPEPKDDIALNIDGFLAFSHVDLDLVEEYVEKLEKGPREYQLCFYQRDWLIGESIPDCILKSIEGSKRVIILMTNNFINSSWGLFEFRSAIKATSMDKDKRLIVIVYPGVDIDKLDTELKIYMKYNTYLRRDDPLFWRKLMFAMPHKQIHGEQPALTAGQAFEVDQL